MYLQRSLGGVVTSLVQEVVVALEDFVQQLLILEVVVLLKVNYQLAQDHIAS